MYIVKDDTKIKLMPVKRGVGGKARLRPKLDSDWPLSNRFNHVIITRGHNTAQWKFVQPLGTTDTTQLKMTLNMISRRSET